MESSGQKRGSAIEVEAAGQTRPVRYRRLWRFTVGFTVLTALTPLAIMTFITYHQDRDATRAENRFAITQILSNTKRTLHFVVEERRSALSLVLASHEYVDLASDSALTEILRDLKESFGGFVDLGVIDADGTQLYYSGPYDLKGRNYKDQPWFYDVNLRGVYVSDVFMGLRNFPHFVIAFQHRRRNGDFFVLRTTIDMQLLYRLLYSLNLDENTDAFLVNHHGVLQTASAFHGDVLDTTNITLPPHSREGEVIQEREEDGVWITAGFAYIESTPFVLYAVRRQQNFFVQWLGMRSGLLWFLTGSISLILIVVFYRHYRMLKYLRDADLRRTKILHNVEYTNKMATIGRMAAGVAHEINNPLAIINEKAGLLQDLANFSPDSKQKEKTIQLVDSILNSVERCSKVTHRLLGFARRMDIAHEPIDIEHLMKEVVGFQQSEMAHRDISVTFDIPDDLPTVDSDRGQLQQVFLNVISNAVAAVSDGGRIDIVARRIRHNEVAITIIDNGSGIAPEDLEHIFEPFYSTKGKFGTGLGLSITRDIVQRLGGHITVESEVGEGTRFIVSLPVSQ